MRQSCELKFLLGEIEILCRHLLGARQPRLLLDGVMIRGRQATLPEFCTA
jgi:hypothetical protein